jgi:enoyl-CoA hydratase/carnithine racemase
VREGGGVLSCLPRDRELDLAVTENAAIRATANFREGLAAFLEKRTPKWRSD